MAALLRTSLPLPALGEAAGGRRLCSEPTASLAAVPADGCRDAGRRYACGTCEGCCAEWMTRAGVSRRRNFFEPVESVRRRGWSLDPVRSRFRVISAAIGDDSAGPSNSSFSCDSTSLVVERDSLHAAAWPINSRESLKLDGAHAIETEDEIQRDDIFTLEESAETFDDVEMRTSSRGTSQLETASLSQAFSSSLGRRLSCSIGSTARIAPRFPRITMNGSAGIVMAIAVAIAGIASAVRSHMHHTREWWMQHVCMRCDGHGLETCHVCNGAGEIRWEGKLYHTDPCPGCLGDGYRKCRQCLGECNFKKGLPPPLERTLLTRRRK